MHLRAVSSGLVSSSLPVQGVYAWSLLEPEKQQDWSYVFLRNSWEIIVRVADTFVTWVVRVGPSLAYGPLGIFLAWIPQASMSAYSFVQSHPHPFHILGWSVFFGPIILLIPCLLAIEFLILVLFQLSFLSHGLAPGSIEDRFDDLKVYFMDWRESCYATVEHWTATFNKWTVDCPPLLIFRVIAGAISFFILLGIWSGW